MPTEYTLHFFREVFEKCPHTIYVYCTTSEMEEKVYEARANEANTKAAQSISFTLDDDHSNVHFLKPINSRFTTFARLRPIVKRRLDKKGFLYVGQDTGHLIHRCHQNGTRSAKKKTRKII